MQKVRIENQAKSKCTKSAEKVKNKSKSTQKIQNKYEKSTKCVFIAESWGGTPPQIVNMYTFRTFFTL